MKKTNKFLSGAAVGAALGIAAGVALSLIDEKKIKKGFISAKREAAMIYKKVSPELKKYKKIGETEFNKFMEKAVNDFSKARKISKAETNEIIKEAKKYWQTVKKHI